MVEPGPKTRFFGNTGFLWAAVAVLLLAALLRLTWLRDVPPGLSQDEVLNADIVSFIWEGQHALFFREGFGHEPLYHYLAAPFQRLYGDNLLSTRLPAGYIGLLLIAATLRWVARDFGRRTALFTGLWLAVSWWPIIFSRVGLRPGLAPLLLVGAAWCWPFPGRSGRYRPFFAGLFLALSIYTYTPAQVMLLLPLLYALYVLLLSLKKRENHQGLRSFFHMVGPPLLVLLTALVLILPLWLTLRADPTLLQRLDQVAGPIEALRAGDVQPLLTNTMQTLGVFGWTGDPRPTYTLPGRPLFGWFSFLLFVTGLVLVFWRARKQDEAGFVLLWLGIALLPSTLTAQAPSTIRLINAMPVVYLLTALALDKGWQWLEIRKSGAAVMTRPVAVGLLTILFFALVLGRTIRDGFFLWPAEVETRLRYQTVFRDMAAHWAAERSGTPVFGDTFYEPIDHDSLRRNLGVDALTARWVQNGTALVFPAGSKAMLYVPEYAPFSPHLMAGARIANAPLYRSTQSPTFSVFPLPDSPAIPLLSRPEPFGDLLTLVGYQRLSENQQGALMLLTDWLVNAPLPPEFALFMHLIDTEGNIVAQYDGLDAARLQAGDRVLQLHVLPLPDPLPAGPFSLQVGVYSRADGSRLLRPDAPPGEPVDRLILEEEIQLKN